MGDVMQAWFDDRRLVSLVKIAGILVTLFGALVLSGFALHLSLLTQINPAWEEMKLTSAILFFFTGVCLYSLSSWQKQARWISCAVAGLAIVMLIYADTRLNSIFCFLGSSICIFLLSYRSQNHKRLRLLSVALIAGSTMACGIISLIGYYADYSEIFPLNYTGKISVHSATVFIILSSVFACLAIIDSKHDLLWVPLPAFLMMILLVVPIIRVMERQDIQKYKDLARVHAVMTAEVTKETAEGVYLAVAQISRKWSSEPDISEAEWDKDAGFYIRNFPMIDNISLLDEDGNILRYKSNGITNLYYY